LRPCSCSSDGRGDPDRQNTHRKGTRTRFPHTRLVLHHGTTCKCQNRVGCALLHSRAQRSMNHSNSLFFGSFVSCSGRVQLYTNAQKGRRLTTKLGDLQLSKLLFLTSSSPHFFFLCQDKEKIYLEKFGNGQLLLSFNNDHGQQRHRHTFLPVAPNKLHHCLSCA